MDYLKKTIKKLDLKQQYEEIDTRLASGWYVDQINRNMKKEYKTEKVSFKISKKIRKKGWFYKFILKLFNHLIVILNASKILPFE